MPPSSPSPFLPGVPDDDSTARRFAALPLAGDVPCDGRARLRFFVPVARIVPSRCGCWPSVAEAAADAAESAVRLRSSASRAKNASMSRPYSSSLSSMNCADLYVSRSRTLRAFFRGASSSLLAAPSESELLGWRRRRRRLCLFLWSSCEARFPFRSSGDFSNCSMTVKDRCRSDSSMPAGIYHSSSSASEKKPCSQTRAQAIEWQRQGAVSAGLDYNPYFIQTKKTNGCLPSSCRKKCTSRNINFNCGFLVAAFA